MKYLQTMVECLCMLGKVAAAGAIIWFVVWLTYFFILLEAWFWRNLFTSRDVLNLIDLIISVIVHFSLLEYWISWLVFSILFSFFFPINTGSGPDQNISCSWYLYLIFYPHLHYIVILEFFILSYKSLIHVNLYITPNCHLSNLMNIVVAMLIMSIPMSLWFFALISVECRIRFI